MQLSQIKLRGLCLSGRSLCLVHSRSELVYRSS
nr:MAG TPA_asm: hypothetical protein [Caudoviricetes sp.]